MILKAITRGNGRDYARYLEQSKKNERVQILEISGTTAPGSLSESLFEMSVVEENTRSGKPLLEVVINPATGEGRMMTKESWKFCMDTIERHIQFQGQPRVGVEQVYKDEPHMHALWSRYDVETGKMLPISHIAQKLKAARIEIEKELGHEHLLSWQEKKQVKEREKIKEEFSFNQVDIGQKVPDSEPILAPKPVAKESTYDRLKREIKERRERDKGYGY